MPRPSFLFSTPAAVMEQLDARLLASAFSEFVGHAQWMSAIGHPVGKSALGEYAVQHRCRIEAGLPLSAGAIVVGRDKLADQRIECLKVVAALPLCDLNVISDDLKAAAADLHRWAYEGSTPSA